MNTVRTTTALLAVATLAGCSVIGAGSPSMAEDMEDEEEDRATMARVTNDSWFNIRVYVEDQGRRQVLGSVSSYESSTFEVPSDMVNTSGEIQLLADPVGSTTNYRSSPVLVDAGQLVQWTVQNSRSQTYSSITVR